jgi:uncharacterized protein
MESWDVGILAVGYPGYNGNAGEVGEDAIHATAQANYDWLIAQGISTNRIVITAHSMGTGAAVPLAAKNKAGGLILESPFTSMAETAQRVVWWLPVNLLITEPFRSDLHIAKVDEPIAWMHGSDDQLIPFSMGQKLFDNVQAKKCAYRIKGGDHDHLWDMGGKEYTRKQAFAMVETGQCL